MALPRTLKNFNVFNQGFSMLGQVKQIALPKLARQMEDYRGGGMDGPVKVDLGQEVLEVESIFAGHMRGILIDYGLLLVNGVLMRFSGAYQRDDTGEVDAVEIVMLGRHTEIDRGTEKAGELTEFKVKSALTYYKEIVNGVPLIEIDLLNFVYTVGGIDMLAAQRSAMSL